MYIFIFLNTAPDGFALGCEDGCMDADGCYLRREEGGGKGELEKKQGSHSYLLWCCNANFVVTSIA